MLHSVSAAKLIKNNGGDLLALRAYDSTRGANIAVVDVTEELSDSAFKRFSFTFTTPPECYSVYVYPAYKSAQKGSAIIDVLLNHAQLVEGATHGPIVITEDAPVTREADVISRELGADLNASEGSVIFSVSGIVAANHTSYLLSLTNGTLDEIVGIDCTETGQLRLVAFEGGAGSRAALGSATGGESRRAAFSWDSSGVAACIDGGSVKTLPVRPFVLTQLYLGGVNNRDGLRTGGVSFADVYTLPHAITAAQLQEVTS